jgi:hypothetical protein
MPDIMIVCPAERIKAKEKKEMYVKWMNGCVLDGTS